MTDAAVRTLWVLRHAKAVDHGSRRTDHERPLTSTGRQAASRLGRWLASGPVAPAGGGCLALPSLALCSDAARTTETIDHVNAELSAPIPVTVRADLYGASTGTALRVVTEEVDDDVAHLMVVGHNPTMAHLAGELLPAPATVPGSGEPSRGARDHDALVGFGFPTCGLVVLAFDVERWSDLARGTGRLITTWSPKG